MIFSKISKFLDKIVFIGKSKSYMLHHSPLLPHLHFLGPGDPKETHALSAETHACYLESNLKKKYKLSFKKV